MYIRMSVLMCLKLSSHTLRFNYLQKGQQKTQTKNKWNHWIYNAMLESRVGRRYLLDSYFDT